MCGIAGIISLNGSKVENGLAKVKKMLASMEYRGPDGSGVLNSKDNKVFLGNNRLAITDPKYKLNGPFSLQDEDYIMSYNGEIYDYLEQSKKLLNKGIQLKSNTDTEVLMKGLILKGLDFLKEIDGCWAFAFYNQKEKKVYISRDLLGEKQIFYIKTDREFIFASEAKALTVIYNDRLSLNTKELVTAIRFFSASLSNTIISQIKKFRPGQTLVFDTSNKNEIKECIPVKLDPMKWKDFFKSQPSDEKVINQLSELMFKSINNRLSRDVPCFTTLSGGIDSNLMAYFATQKNKNIDTIFIKTANEMLKSNEGEELNEQEASRYTAKKLNTNHIEIKVNPEETTAMLNNNACSSIDGLIDWGTVTFELIGQAVREQGYKVILVSEGADELCGYTIDMNNYIIAEKQKNSPFISKIIASFNKEKYIRKVFRRISYISEKTFEPYCNNIPFIFKPHHEAAGHDYLSKCFQRKVVNSTNSDYGSIDDNYKELLDILDYSQKGALSYMNFSIPDFSNLRLDKGFMRASVEPRVPFLNLDLVNFLLSMPAHYKYRQGYSKFILRKMVEKFIGKKIAWRRKHGFSYPIWKLPNIRKGLNIERNIASSSILDNLPWNNNGRKYLEKNINKKMAKLSWPMYVLSQIEKKYQLN